MKFLLLSVLCLLLSISLMETKSNKMDNPLKHLIQKRNDGSNNMKKDLNGSFFGIIDLEKEKHTLTTLWVFSLYLITASIIKLAYHQSNFLTSTIPESCVLIMVGIGFGTLTKYLIELILDNKVVIYNRINEFKRFPKFSVDLFLFGLMPPIILNAAFQLHNEYFFENLITIIMYAIVGTLINEFMIGVSLYSLAIFGFEWLDFPRISLIELLVFSNAISAVDPVTVLTIFSDLKVNKPLYYLVFGESLLNDAVVIVVHSLLDTFVSSPLITSNDLLLGMNHFFFTSVGGFMIGVIFGLMTAFITLYTEHSLVIEPMIVIGMAYCSFLTADLVTWSGLISLIGCGLVQFEFAWDNISRKTRITVKYFILTLSSVADLLIFFFLGQMLINEDQHWNTAFILFTILFSLLYRTVSVFGLTYISNHYFHRTRPINLEEQALMAYGGLRGAVAFAMIALLEENEDIENIGLLKTTTFVLIFFTVFVLGGTTKPLLNFLRIQRETVDNKKLCFLLNDKVIDIVINGIEDFVGNPSTMNFIKHKLQSLILFLKKYLCKKEQDKIIGREIPKLLSATNMLQDEKLTVKKKPVLKDQKISAQINNIEDFHKKTEEITEKIYSKKAVFADNIFQKLDRNAFAVKEIHRKHPTPKELSSGVIAANQHFKPSNKMLSALRHILNDKELIKKRFGPPIPQSNDSEVKKNEPNFEQKTEEEDKLTKKEINESNEQKPKPESNQKN